MSLRACISKQEAPREAGSVSRERLPTIVRVHDWFNLVVLAVLNALNIAYIVAVDPRVGTVLLWASLAYFIADGAFVALYPRCVRSPVVILSHHIVSTALILIPLRYPAYCWCLSYCMLVEVNTWFLISKRTIHVAAALQEALFLATWVALRNVWYPALIVVFYYEWRAATRHAGTPWNWVLTAPILQAGLTGLNFHWTWALFSRRKAERPKQL